MLVTMATRVRHLSRISISIGKKHAGCGIKSAETAPVSPVIRKTTNKLNLLYKTGQVLYKAKVVTSITSIESHLLAPGAKNIEEICQQWSYTFNVSTVTISLCVYACLNRLEH